MHQLIHGLVYAESPDDALTEARYDVFTPLVEKNLFDYFVTFDQDGLGVSGKDRWGELPAATPAESEQGQELIQRGWEATVDEYRRSFDRLQDFLDDHEPEEFWNDGEVHGEYVLDFHRIGQFQGPATFLYDQNGDGIRDKAHLEQVENYWEDLETQQYENLNLYVVPADVHF
jgi:hypothetical protein